MEKLKSECGITLIALVVTIIVLLILAGITIQIVLKGGILETAENASDQYKIAAAREKLSITLSNAQMDKVTNIKYNQDEYLDEFIVNNTSNTEVLDDIVITDGYAFELDRSVPKIGEYIGEKEKLVFPEVSTTVTLAKDYKAATITINAKEEINGISKIEVLQGGYVLETYTYENKKEPIIENYITKYNGTYIIKVYANLAVRKKAEVIGLVSSVIYSPDGNKEYQKEHQVKVSVQDEADKVTSLKYQWLQTTVEPAPETFTNTCNNNEIITGKDFTGTYYLWTLLETQSGKTNICRSKEFHFDNKGPTVTLTSTPVSQNSFTLTATANDEHSSIAKYEFYVENELKETIETEESSASYTISNLSMGNYNCFVIVTDKLENQTKKVASETPRTKQYTWEKYNITTKTSYEIQEDGSGETSYKGGRNKFGTISGLSFNSEKGYWTFSSTGSRDYNDMTNATVRLLNGPVTNSVTSYRRIGRNTRTSIDSDYGSRYHYEYTDYTAVKKSEQIQGTTSYGNVYSTNRNQYPDNNKSGSYWYKYLGIK